MMCSDPRMKAEHFQFMRPRLPRDHKSAGDLCNFVPAIDVDDSNSLVMEVFTTQRDLVSLAVVEHERPIGLINRNIFMSQMSKLYHRELYDKKSCIAFLVKRPWPMASSSPVKDASSDWATVCN